MFELKGNRLITRDTEFCLPFLSLYYIKDAVLYHLGVVELHGCEKNIYRTYHCLIEIEKLFLKKICFKHQVS